jgi:hypothetical protein
MHRHGIDLLLLLSTPGVWLMEMMGPQQARCDDLRRACQSRGVSTHAWVWCIRWTFFFCFLISYRLYHSQIYVTCVTKTIRSELRQVRMAIGVSDSGSNPMCLCGVCVSTCSSASVMCRWYHMLCDVWAPSLNERWAVGIRQRVAQLAYFLTGGSGVRTDCSELGSFSVLSNCAK